MRNTAAIILAAGKGTRLKGIRPKILRKVGNKSVIVHALELLDELDLKERVLVLGHESRIIDKELIKAGFREKIAIQKNLLGTSKALETGLAETGPTIDTILVLYGDDSSLYKAATISNFIKHHQSKNNPITFLTSSLHKPTEIGGLVVDKKDGVIGVMGMKEMMEKKITKHDVLCGAFCFNHKWIRKHIKQIKKNRRSGEYPLPGIINIAKANGAKIDIFRLKHESEWNSLNTKEELVKTRNKYKEND